MPYTVKPFCIKVSVMSFLIVLFGQNCFHKFQILLSGEKTRFTHYLLLLSWGKVVLNSIKDIVYISQVIAEVLHSESLMAESQD